MGQASPLAELGIQYGDYAVWQRQWLQGEVLERQIGYWKKQLEGMPGALELPADCPRPAVQSFEGGVEIRSVEPELWEGLKRLSRQEGATLFMTLLAAYEVLLGRYSGQEDFAVGTPVANRSRMETEGLIGFFVNTLVMRARLDGRPSFREVLGRVREAALGGYTHQDVPFERLVEELAPERDLSRSPVFQVMFTLQNAAMSTSGFGGLEAVAEPVEAQATRHDLEVHLVEADGELRGQVVFSTELFDRETIDRFALSRYLRVLGAAVAAPDMLVSDIDITGPRARAELTQRGTSPAPPASARTGGTGPTGGTGGRRRLDGRGGPAPAGVDRFAGDVRQRPGAAAVTCGAERLTYEELDERSGLAPRGGAAGSGHRSRVACRGVPDRSVLLVTALLAVLKTGAAYVPLDPAYPPRLEFMVRDSRAALILAGAEAGEAARWEVRRRSSAPAPSPSVEPRKDPPRAARVTRCQVTR